MARLQTLVVGIDLGERYLERVRTAFPDLRVLVAVERDQLLRALPKADAFLGWGLDADLLTAAPRLGWAQSIGAGVDGFRFPELLDSGVLLTNMSGIHAPNIAEHVLALMLAFARGLPGVVRAHERHEWHHRPWDSFELNGQTLCVVGLGDIGLALAERAAALGMNVTGVRRRDGEVPPFIRRVALPEMMGPLLAEADHVALCLPLTPRTRHLLDAERLGWVKQGAYIYNVGRGETLDQDALVASLREGRLAGAGLDVTVPEPLPADHPLWEFPNVLITAHSSGGSPHLWDRAVALLLENIARYREGRELVNMVDKREGY